MFGACRWFETHEGHLHSDQQLQGKTHKAFRHETYAPPDAYAAEGGFGADQGEQSIKVITYHKKHGNIGTLAIRPEMFIN